MKTTGTNTSGLNDTDLLTLIGAAAKEVFEAVALGLSPHEITFAVGTLARFSAELERRAASKGDTSVYAEAAISLSL